MLVEQGEQEFEKTEGSGGSSARLVKPRRRRMVVRRDAAGVRGRTRGLAVLTNAVGLTRSGPAQGYGQPVAGYTGARMELLRGAPCLARRQRQTDRCGCSLAARVWEVECRAGRRSQSHISPRQASVGIAGYAESVAPVLLRLASGAYRTSGVPQWTTPLCGRLATLCQPARP